MKEMGIQNVFGDADMLFDLVRFRPCFHMSHPGPIINLMILVSSITIPFVSSTYRVIPTIRFVGG